MSVSRRKAGREKKNLLWRRLRQQGGRNQPFCGAGSSAVAAGAPETQKEGCQTHAISVDEDLSARHAKTKTADAKPATQVAASSVDDDTPAAHAKTKTAENAKPATHVRSRTARYRSMPPFLRRVDLFLQGR